MYCELALTPREAANEKLIREKCLQKYNLQSESVALIRIIKRSIDARSNKVKILLRLKVFFTNDTIFDRTQERAFKNVRSAPEVHIAGTGPAGLFAALQLIESGLKPILIERGKNVRERRKDLALLIKNHLVNENSNYCFGEGGAGTYSDGKLYTRSGKRGNITRVLETFVQFGADEEILIDAHPHIGTNRLPGIISNITETIINCGGEILYNHILHDIDYTSQGIDKIHVRSLINNHSMTLRCTALILATGHSARDVFHMLDNKKILIDSKPIAIGVRIEHPQELIDKMQYHCNIRDPFLPAASYKLVYQTEQKTGVYSFCMCPGGIIAPAMTANKEIVVNGWSPSKRNNPFANSGMVVSISEILYAKKYRGNLAAMLYQQNMEQNAFQSVNKGITAPAQRMDDFIQGKNSSTLPKNSYLPGTESCNLAEVLTKDIYHPLREALIYFGKIMKGYRTNDAILVGVESRTSSPIRIPRDPVTCMHHQVNGLFPCGEGASYAGGIVSAAMDGERCALAVLNYLKN